MSRKTKREENPILANKKQTTQSNSLRKSPSPKGFPSIIFNIYR